MKKKIYQKNIRKHLRWKNFDFDLYFFQCCYLVCLIFLSALLFSLIFAKLEKKFDLRDSPASVFEEISKP
ncbi:hypothetical protein [endosymbiont GvMRE of Glomus versiforme]|uniref:hypothetical protein n=1 Tax=endosymbiont GvMRE of Glomus versiforme TaxID=2039283 RepID=UPI000EC9EA52|nr:hypothetical protein [endosymbiont GvMRE of Glomus versiforme]RHZ37025.1 hypothetical protein GvMRE_I2g306 [endosymbiont GvMRE of Glomus versiforme]